MKKYILRQHISSPTLNCDAGAIGEEKDGRVWFDNRRFFFTTHTVINNPAWFREYEPAPNSVLERNQKEEGKDWEIVEFENKKGDRFFIKDGEYRSYWWGDEISGLTEADCLSGHPLSIHSVKRLSDGEVFSVGETINCRRWGTQIIKEFFIMNDGEMIAGFSTCNSPLKELSHAIPPPPPQQSKRIEVRYAGRGQDGPQYIVEGMDEGELRHLLFKEGKLTVDKETAEALSASPHCQRVEVSDIKNAGGVGIDGWYHYTFNIKDNLSEAELSVIKSLIQQAVNVDDGKAIVDVAELKRLHFIEEAYAEIYDLLKKQKRDDL